MRACDSISSDFKTTCDRGKEICFPPVHIADGCKQCTSDTESTRQCTLDRQCFADDIVILAKDARTLHFIINIWNVDMESRSMTINVNQTKSMIISKATIKSSIMLNNQEIEQVSSFDR